MVELSDPSAMFCIDCRYPLHSLESRRCPECGRAFDPTNAQTYAHTRRLRAASFDAYVALICLLGFGLLVLERFSRQAPHGGPLAHTSVDDHIPWVISGALAIGFGIGALRRDGWANKLSACFTLAIAVPTVLWIIYRVGWDTIWTYWTYWHWVQPAW